MSFDKVKSIHSLLDKGLFFEINATIENLSRMKKSIRLLFEVKKMNYNRN